VNFLCGFTKARYGMVFRMGGAIRVCDPILQGKMTATNDDARKTTCSVVLAMYLNI
jgi:hypothetical protein